MCISDKADIVFDTDTTLVFRYPQLRAAYRSYNLNIYPTISRSLSYIAWSSLFRESLKLYDQASRAISTG